ncbi:MAG: helix-turn-helix transcriptional regulator [Alistipes sp.]|nr:helix-turn-helix transcriptional regulator [Alistipes sp.]
MKKSVEIYPQEFLEQEIKQQIDQDSLKSKLSERESKRLEQALIEGVIQGLSIEELANICCCSESTFKRRFVDHYNMSPHRWILRCRIGLARQILSTTNIPITDVATTCGFINTSHFIAKFKHYVGMTPHQYRTDNKLTAKE